MLSIMNFKRLSLVGIVFVAAYIAFGLRISNGITIEDHIAIKALQIRQDCGSSFNDFDDELKCIQKIQFEVQNIGALKCAERSDTIEPIDYINRSYGCCSARARFIEKALRSVGFETRRVFLIKPHRGFSVSNLLPFGQSSHSTTEVLTRRGWMGVDANYPFVLVDADNVPYTYKEGFTNQFVKALMTPGDFFTGEIDVIYGLYSRHGLSFGAKLPGPEYHFNEMLWNFKA